MAKSKTYELALRIAGKVDSSLAKSCREADRHLSALGESARTAGKIASTALSAGAAGATAVAAAGAGAYMQHEKAASSLSAATGAVGDELGKLTGVMESVYAANFGDSIADVADAVSLVDRNLKGLSSEQIEEATRAALLLKETMGYGADESTRAAAAIEKNFNVAAGQAFSLIAAGAQNGLDFSGEMLDAVSEYSVHFAKLGFTADSMFGLMQSGSESTAWNLDKVGDAIKEFSIRAINGSKTTAAAFNDLGYDSNAMMMTFAVGGEGANQAFFDVLNTLMGVDDAVKRDAIGVALFGTMWEDLGVEAMAAMAKASTAAYDTGDALSQMEAALQDDLSWLGGAALRQLEVIAASAGAMLEPYAKEGLGYIISDTIPALGAAVQEIMPRIIEAGKWLWENRDAIVAVATGVAAGVGAYKAIKLTLTAYNAVVSLHKVAVDALAVRSYPALIAAKIKDKAVTLQIYALYAKDALIKAKNTAAMMAHTAAVNASILASRAAAVAARGLGVSVRFLTSPFGRATIVITALVAAGVLLYKNWDTVKAKAAALAAAFGDRFPAMAAYISGWWQSAAAAGANVREVLSNIVGFVDNVFAGNWEAAWENVTAIFGNTFGAVANLAKAPINGVISSINWVLSKVNDISVTIPEWVPGVGGQTLGFKLPTIPALSVGGIATSATLAMIGEGREPEAILPLSKLAGLLDKWGGKSRTGGRPVMGGDEQIVFSPIFNFYGSVSREQAVEAGRLSFAEFKRLYQRMKAEEQRKSFSPA